MKRNIPVYKLFKLSTDFWMLTLRKVTHTLLSIRSWLGVFPDSVKSSLSLRTDIPQFMIYTKDKVRVVENPSGWTNSPSLKKDGVVSFGPNNGLFVERKHIVGVIDPCHQIRHDRERGAATTPSLRHGFWRPNKESIRLTDTAFQFKVIPQKFRCTLVGTQLILPLIFSQVSAEKL